MRLLVLLTAVMSLGACGGSSVTGSVKGQSLQVERAILTAHARSTSATSAGVILSTDPNECENLSNRLQSLPQLFLNFIGGPEGLGAGDYGWIDQHDAAQASVERRFWGEFFGTGGVEAELTAGTATIEELQLGDAAFLQGRFDAKFDGDTMSGEFRATLCPE